MCTGVKPIFCVNYQVHLPDCVEQLAFCCRGAVFAADLMKAFDTLVYPAFFYTQVRNLAWDYCGNVCPVVVYSVQRIILLCSNHLVALP